LIILTSSRHAELTQTTIDFLHKYLKGKQNCGVDAAVKQLNTSAFISDIYKTKACPKDYSLTRNDKKYLIKMGTYCGVQVRPTDEDYETIKMLERKGFVYEDVSNDMYNFVADIITTIVFKFALKVVHLPLENIKILSIVDVALEAFRRISGNLLSNVLECKKENIEKDPKKIHLSEDQWVCEFYCALKTMLPIDEGMFIISQAGKELDPEFGGELDIYVDDTLNLAFELLVEGNDPLGHILRKLKADDPNYLKDVKLVNPLTFYKFPKHANYLVIDCRRLNFRELRETATDIHGNTLDLTKYDLHQYLMRVQYAEDFSALSIFYNEEFLTEIKLQ